ncbi:hypothetical protein FDUTEX481_08663 [Tolypothrix sp. PCC 7601]|nr:hypothetical protein FDUTEX481_08663 [Tolypothrix sp. PCC 7601]
MIWEKGNGKRVRVNSILFPFSLSPLTELYWALPCLYNYLYLTNLQSAVRFTL